MPARKSAAILKLRGDDKVHTVRWRKKNRDAELKATQASGPLGDEPPAWMEGAKFAKLRATYAEILERAHKGVLCQADGPIVEMTATLLHDFRSTHGQVDDKTLGKLITCLDRLGMTPSARGRVAMLAADKDKDEDNPLNEFTA